MYRNGQQQLPDCFSRGTTALEGGCGHWCGGDGDYPGSQRSVSVLSSSGSLVSTRVQGRKPGGLIAPRTLPPTSHPTAHSRLGFVFNSPALGVKRPNSEALPLHPPRPPPRPGFLWCGARVHSQKPSGAVHSGFLHFRRQQTVFKGGILPEGGCQGSFSKMLGSAGAGRLLALFRSQSCAGLAR